MAEPIVDQEIIDEELPVDPVEDTPVEEVQEETPVEEEVVEDEDEPEKPVSRRQNLRIQELLTRNRELENTVRREAPKTGLDYRTALDADDDTIATLDADRQAYGDEAYKAGLEQAKGAEFRLNLKIDAPKMEAKYPLINPRDEEKFNPVVADALNRMYMKEVGYDPKTGTVKHSDLSYEDFIESQMELAEEIANEKVARSTKNITKQAAKTGMRPDGSKAKTMNLNQAPEDMSDAELDAYLAQVVPPKKRR